MLDELSAIAHVNETETSGLSINASSDVIAQRACCAVCSSSKLEVAIALPDLPLTARYSTELVKNKVPGVDQQLLICTNCGHGQLARQISPEALYCDNYSFRTSASETARKGTSFYLSMLDELTEGRKLDCVLDVGCNDLHLLEQLHDRSKNRIGIDPIWSTKENRVKDKGITVIGANIEDVDLKSVLPSAPDLVVCRHTLEHIYQPKAVMEQLLKVASKDTLFLFEVPGFDALIKRFRFDQVFHQHLQYFSLASFRRLIKEFGCTYMSHRENYHDWGALLIAFHMDNCTSLDTGHDENVPYDLHSIYQGYSVFQQALSGVHNVLRSFEGTVIYGYGAAQMLPVLAYHLHDDLSLLEAVIDDDPAKAGLYYWNLPLSISSSSDVRKMDESSVFITAVDCVASIMKKLLVTRPKNIIYPFNII